MLCVWMICFVHGDCGWVMVDCDVNTTTYCNLDSIRSTTATSEIVYK